MDFLATTGRRKVLFGLLYLSEGAPIGFIWLGLPTRLRAMEVPLDRITWLMAMLILPWTLKFLWAPLVDLFRGPKWGLKHSIIASQVVMGATLLPLFWLDLRIDFAIVSMWLLAHAFAAATQDVAIDSLCIQQSMLAERGSLNGAMQCGVLTGRAIMGGGSLMLERWIGFNGVVAVLIGLVSFSLIVLAFAKEKQLAATAGVAESIGQRMLQLMRQLRRGARKPIIWFGFAFALTVPAAFKSAEAILGPFLVDRGYSEFDVGRFTSTAIIGGMIVGSVLAGRFSHRWADRRLLTGAVIANLLAIAAVAIADLSSDRSGGIALLVALTVVSITIGCFTVAMYNWLMNLTDPLMAATQFTAFMAASNVCEAWSTTLIGRLQIAWGYPAAMLCLCAISATAAIVIALKLPPSPE
ncbi:muropeptide transporter [Rubripirellula tenax]|uniref:Muropeptide transporter n=1 Tax=Rubripirellula tenax TaxID=2528015 RepID=A0A5C6FH87_9BACT|nr:MFS transporter [Rubripirellula tenax]TWU60838.1 muropeptide transporter [Rubripirellula tenax]